MGRELPFAIVDVFAEQRYAGNQLAVLRHAGNLDPAEMLQIARETHFSETTFVLSDELRDGGYDVRIFTPGGEVPFAGHPTLGTAAVIRQNIIGRPVEQVVLNLGVGPIPVTFQVDSAGNETLWMRQIAPEFGPTHPAETLAAVLGLDPAAIDSRYPVQEVSTGLPDTLVPLRSLADLRAIKLDMALHDAFVETCEAKTILAFCPQTYHEENDLCARMFAPYFDIAEDPATGSANGCLAAYLAHYRVLGEPQVAARVEQGYEIGRPSLLHLRADATADDYVIQVGGRVVPVASGLWD